MHICRNRRLGGGQPEELTALAGRVMRLAVAFSLTILAGCASPGVPLPPSLKLPEVVDDLAVTRVGDQVRLHWTTPAKTTDGRAFTGAITAEICRETVAAPPPATQVQGASAAAPPCSPVARLAVKPGASESADPLPTSLTAAPARLLAYRVQLRNSRGRTAGPSAAVFTASGPAPDPVQGLRGKASKQGAELEWRAVGASVDAVELDRTAVEPPVEPAAGGKIGAAPKPPAEARFLARGGVAAGAAAAGGGAGAGDAGGAIDRTAQTGTTYRYTAQRVRTVLPGGHRVEVRSLPSATVTVAMLDVFPPDPPTGLVASPGFVGGEPGSQALDHTPRPAIDLSWEPAIEPRVAGYRVYRREGEGTARRLSSELIPVPAYRDLTVEAGRRYTYRVTAVDGAGNESALSGEATESAPAK